ncbi:hypothetical protein [Bacillus tuaregi]|uniref:hypothetical protein n=1 Tax=Bacillus tuaregi TaxID=1816695 RepID=UPI00135632F4|nr:hypothetical protein [Bacillus tuaregi]
MDNAENLKQLLRQYGYPEEAVNRFIKEAQGLELEEIRKTIMPYQDITAHK